MSTERNERTAPKITVDDLVESAINGAVRALKVRPEEIRKMQGLYARWQVTCGIFPYPDILTSIETGQAGQKE